MFRKFELKELKREIILYELLLWMKNYDYFVVGESGEYSNALLNYPTTKGRSVGIQGGFAFLVQLHPIDCY